MYDALIFGDYYGISELEYLREQYGDGIIRDAYVEIFEPFTKTEEGKVTTAIAGK